VKTISDEYKKLNKELHESISGYGKIAKSKTRKSLQVTRTVGAGSLLDYGCGKGKLVKVLRRELPNIHYTEYDPAILGKDTAPDGTFDLVTCTDVLEHIEPEFLSNTLHHLFSYAYKALYIVVARKLSNKQLGDGRNTHLIVQDHKEWKKLIKQYCEEYGFSIKHATDYSKVQKSEFLIYSNSYLQGKKQDET